MLLSAASKGRLHDHLDARSGDQGSGIVGDKGRARLMRVGERGGGILAVRPAGGFQLAMRARNVEIGDAGHVHALRQARLRQEHCAELAGADHADGHRPAGRFAFEQLGVEVHGMRAPST